MDTTTGAGGGPAIALANGASMPLLGFGTWRLTGRQAYAAVRTALDTGYRLVDTATMYRNEAQVGRAVRDSGIPRERLFVTTKLPPEHAGRERETIERSLRALGVDHVDLWLVHWPPRGSAGVRTWEQFLVLRDHGYATSVGVSNYSIAQVDRLVDATGEAPAVNQVPWAPALHDAGFLAASRDRGVAVEGYSPLENTHLGDPTLSAIARGHGVTTAQVVLRWHLQHEIVAIPKSATPARIRSNHDVFGFTLSDREMARIDALGA
jgi:diketogulonate reductase-like aldo/keto reductase